MKASLVCLRALLSLVALAVLIPGIHGQEVRKEKEKATGADKPAAKFDPAAVRKLIEQLKSKDFRTREKATRELSRLDEVPDGLREAARSGDLEARRRAQKVLNHITARLEEKAFKALIADLHKVELDRFIRRMVTDEKFAGDEQWKLIQALARAVTQKANELSGQRFPVPDFDLKSLPLADLARGSVDIRKKRLLLRNPEPYITSLQDCVILCTGRTPRMTGLTNSILIVDGDFTGATGVENSLLIVRGNVGRVTSVHKSIILATGNFLGATGCDNSFLQVNNQRIRFTTSSNSVIVKTAVRTTGQTTSRVLDTDKGPLRLLRFGKRKTDAQLAWGREVNDLAVAITPADQEHRFLVRWKNVGKGLLEIPWTRFNSAVMDKHADDLLGHVYLKGPGGKLVPARQYPGLPADRLPFFLNNVVLGPGQTHEEVIDLWAYVERPAAGKYQLSVELHIPAGRGRLEVEARLWAGKVRSNTLEITVGK
jgi:hypothetical protein